MKKYLYIACGSMLALAGCTRDADVEPARPVESGKVVLTGLSGEVTRTGFGEASEGVVPFRWSAGDCIWVGDVKSEPLESSGEKGAFVFESVAAADSYDVIYNMTGSAARTASIPAEQTQAEAGRPDLGRNGDFGYATADANRTFVLNHATSYVWFDVSSADVTARLESISLSVSGGHAIAGEAVFAEGALGACEGSSSVTLNFGEEGVALPTQHSDTEVFAAMVLYPADLSEATVSVVYTFADGSVYMQSRAGRRLAPGGTLRISATIAAADCKRDGVFYLTENGVAEEIPESVTYLKAVTLGEGKLAAADLSAIASRLKAGAVLDFAEATYEAAEFPTVFSRKTTLREISLPCNILTMPSTGTYATAFYGCTGLETVALPDGLTEIAARAFSGCSKLASVRLPSTLTSIGEYAFYDCKALADVVVPEKITTLSRSLFAGCTGLKSVTIPAGVKTIDSGAFNKCSALESIELPEGLTTLGSQAFMNCSALKSVRIPDGVTAIPNETFAYCSVLETVELPSALKTIGNMGFYKNNALRSISFPETLETIGTNSFDECHSLADVTIDIPVVTDYSFRDCGCTTIVLGEKVTEVGRNAFYGYSDESGNVKSITCRAQTPPELGQTPFDGIGKNVEGKKYLYVPAASYEAYEKEWASVIGQGYILEDISDQELTDGVWYRVSREEKWTTTMPDTFSALYVRTVGEQTISAEALQSVVARLAAQSAPATLDFSTADYVSAEFPALLAGNEKLGGIRLFENTTSIADGAFKGCTALARAVVPSGVAAVGPSTFEGCSALAEVTLPSSVASIADKAFSGCAALSEIALGNVKSIGDEAFAASGLTEVSLGGTTLGAKAFRDCPALAAVELGSIGTVPAESFKGCTSLTSLTVPASVTAVDAGAFEGCSKLADLSLGSGVTTVGDRAFADCGLTALVLPDNVTELGSEVFAGNPTLASVKFGAGITAVSDGAFAGNDVIERLTIPKTVESIGAGAFAGWSKLNTLTVSGDALASIGSKAFENAVLLADIYCEPTTAPTVAADSFAGAGASVQGARTVHVPSVDAYSAWTAACSGYTFAALGDDYLSEGVYYRVSAGDKWSAELPASFSTLFVKTAGDNTAMSASQLSAVAAAVKGLSAAATVDLSEAVYESATFPAVFRDNKNLSDIVLPKNITAVAKHVFSGSGLIRAHVSAAVTYDVNTYASCASLASVTFDEYVPKITDAMFQGCPLTQVVLPAEVTTIGSNAFNGCKSLAKVSFGTKLKTIGSAAFSGCSALTALIFPDATESIGQNAFADCYNLRSVSFGRGMKEIGTYSFTGYDWTGTGQGGCPLLGEIICRAATPPTLEESYGSGPFGGSYEIVAGSKAETRVIHLPESDDPSLSTGGGYVNSGWVQLTMAPYNFTFVYDVEPTGTWK
ncbi:leucine-rich repeat domain-containing protein [Alistipes communis]|uniref:leucine-rich repeat domain-containing protein n=1 Tax=Alistipes communis TaxID=2585118 RepID=UPI003A84C727